MKTTTKTNLTDAITLISMAIIVIAYWVIIGCAVAGNTGVLACSTAIVYVIFSTALFIKYIGAGSNRIIRVLAAELCICLALGLPYLVIFNICH
mgnify:CR=1 FL=1